MATLADLLPAGTWTAADTTLLLRVLRKLDRWFTPATLATSPPARSVVIQASGAVGSGQGTPLCQPSLTRVGALVFAPATATNLYVSTQQNFGQVSVTAQSAQYGMFFAAGTYLSFSQEYAGPLFAYNAGTVGSAALDVRVLELFGDPAAIG